MIKLNEVLMSFESHHIITKENASIGVIKGAANIAPMLTAAEPYKSPAIAIRQDTIVSMYYSTVERTP